MKVMDNKSQDNQMGIKAPKRFSGTGGQEHSAAGTVRTVILAIVAAELVIDIVEFCSFMMSGATAGGEIVAIIVLPIYFLAVIGLLVGTLLSCVVEGRVLSRHPLVIIDWMLVIIPIVIMLVRSTAGA